MNGNDNLWKTSDILTLGILTTAGAVLSYVASASGALHNLGIHGWAAELAVLVAIALAVLSQRLWARHRRISALTRFAARPLCTVKGSALGIVPSSLARARLEDGTAPYVPRDRDARLTRMLRGGQVVILVGPSGAGKTTTAFNVARDVYGAMRVLAPNEPSGDPTGGDRASLDELLEMTMRFPWRHAGYLLWIDDLGRYLDEGTVSVAKLNRWLDANPKRRIIATLSSADQTRHEQAEGLAGKLVRRLMTTADVHELGIKWTKAEQRRARKAYVGLGDDAYPHLARYLAFGPLLRDRYRRATEESASAWAVVRAIADCKRAGIQPVSPDLLIELLPLYLPGGFIRADLGQTMREGLEWLVQPIDDEIALVLAGGGDPACFSVPDIVVELVQGEGRGFQDGFWEILLRQRAGNWEKIRLAQVALVYGHKGIAREATDALMREESTESEVRRAAHRLWSELAKSQPHEVSEILQRASGDTPPPAPTSEPPELMLDQRFWRTRHRILAAINDSEAAKTIVRICTLFCADVMSLWVSLLAAYWAIDAAGLEQARAAADKRIAFVVLVAVLLFYISGLYRARSRRASFAQLLAALTQVGGMFIILRVIVGAKVGSYSLIVVTIVFAFFALGVARKIHLFLTAWLHRMALGRAPRRVLIGAREEVEHVVALAPKAVGLYQTIGWIRTGPATGNAAGISCLGSVEDLARLIDECLVDDLVLCGDRLQAAAITRITEVAWVKHVDLRVVSRSGFLVSESRYVPGEQLPLDELRVPVLDASQRLVKRSFDIAVSFVGLVACLPLWILIVFSIRVSSKGRAIQSVSREGIGAKPFEMRRFRTTYLPAARGGQAVVTPVGRWLRRTALDELPQLLNVLRGEMSLVGPRPILREEFERLEEWQLRRYLVLPGITGLWQISGRQDHDFADMVRLDFHYVQHWSLFEDIEILLKSVPISLWGERAVIARGGQVEPSPAASSDT